MKGLSSPPFVVYPDLFISTGKDLSSRWTYSIPEDGYVFDETEPVTKSFPIDFERSLVLEGKTLSLRKGAKTLAELEDVSSFLYLGEGISLITNTENEAKIIEIRSAELSGIPFKSGPRTRFEDPSAQGEAENFDVIMEGEETRYISPYERFSVSRDFVLFLGYDGNMEVYSLRPFAGVMERDNVSGAAFVGKYLVTVRIVGDQHHLVLENWNSSTSQDTEVISSSGSISPLRYGIVVLGDTSFLLYGGEGETETSLWSVAHGTLVREQVFLQIPIRIASDAFILNRILMRLESKRGEYHPAQVLPSDKLSLRYPTKKKRRGIARSLMTPQTRVPLEMVEIIVDFCVEFIPPTDYVS